MNLGTRLKTIYSFIDFNDSVADIGCDHGYLLIELAKNGFKNSLLGVENKVGPFNSFLYNLKINKLDTIINYSLSSGLEKVDSKYNSIVLAGMGTENIIKIINEHKEKLNFIDSFIVDSHTEVPKLRKFFINLGYKIEKEKIIEENKIVYEIIRFVKGSTNYSKIELKYGPIILKDKDEDFINIYTSRLNYLKETVKTASNNVYLNKLNNEIKEIEEILNYGN